MRERREENLHSGHRRRLRERYKTGGEAGLEDHVLLELLLCYAIPRKDVNGLAHRLIDAFGSLSGAMDAETEDLLQVVNNVIRRMKFDGSLRRLHEKYGLVYA